VVRGIPFRIAICYEAGSEILYKDSPRYLIAISNNAWFDGSIEPTQQRILLRYYAKKYGTLIHHATNFSRSEIITP